MTFYAGNIRKMRTEHNEEISYKLPIGDDLVDMNELIGSDIELKYEGLINCKRCGRKTNKSFSQGFCYPCFLNAPENSPCIIHPELCEGHLGKGRDIEWEEKYHVVPHIVYIALTSVVKVGVTKHSQIPTRFIDQGAKQVLIVAETPYRQLAGQIEVFLKDYYADKTNWRNMLKDIVTDADLAEEKENIENLIYDGMGELYTEYITDELTPMVFNYPVLQYPKTVKSIGFDKMPHIQSKLKGIRGQYLYFENNQVLNVRKHEGYFVQLTANSNQRTVISNQ